MQKFDVSSFYRLGVMVGVHHRTFATLVNDMPERVRALHDLKRCFELFLDTSMEANWKATRECARKVITLLEPRVGNSPAELYVAPFESGYEFRVRNAIAAFETTFTSESQDANIFSVSQKGTHSTLDLMERATDNLPLNVQSRLTPEARFDLSEAGRCLALDCHTAAGLHTLRAIEAMIYVYLKKLSKQSAFRRQDRNWGAYIRLLTTHNADPKVTALLAHMKDYYRNPLMHPEQTLDANEAFSLFNTSLSALIQLDAAIEAIP